MEVKQEFMINHAPCSQVTIEYHKSFVERMVLRDWSTFDCLICKENIFSLLYLIYLSCSHPNVFWPRNWAFVKLSYSVVR